MIIGEGRPWFCKGDQSILEMSVKDNDNKGQ